MDLPIAKSLQEVRDGVLVWEAFSPHHKVELTSSAIVADGNLYVFDPIPLMEELLRSLKATGLPRAVILTNENHFRNSEDLRNRWKIPVLAGHGAEFEGQPTTWLMPGEDLYDGFRVFRLEGGAGGELAFFHPDSKTLIVGDVLFNLPGHGFGVLPDRYCTDRPKLLQQLRKLLTLDFDLLVMAHGQPIKDDPAARIKELLDGVAA